MPADAPTPMPRYTRRAAIRGGLLAAGAASAALTMGATLPARVLAAGAQATGSTGPSPAGALLAANLDFGFRLQNALAKAGLGQNLFFSPLSISTALAMVYNGAAGATQQAMAGALGYKTLRPSEVNAASLGLLTALRARDPQVALSIADSVWLRNGFAVVPGFAATLKTYYGAGLQSLNFGDSHAPGIINAWVSRETHGLIPSIIKSIDAATVMYLINAVYFKAAWSSPFQASETSPGTFTAGGGRPISVPMMANVGMFSYSKSESTEAIRLPYGVGKISMYIVLPAANSSLQACMKGLDAAAWTALVKTLRPQHGIIRMPRFSVSYGTSLKPALTALGMGQAFDPNTAVFPGIIQHERAFITDALHKALVKVDENGTLAAAVTSIGIGATAVIADTFTMDVNRPFFCAIRDDVSGALLFMGGIVNPG
jgi:serpin B